jgi:hypothetical protein
MLGNVARYALRWANRRWFAVVVGATAAAANSGTSASGEECRQQEGKAEETLLRRDLRSRWLCNHVLRNGRHSLVEERENRTTILWAHLRKRWRDYNRQSSKQDNRLFHYALRESCHP